MPRVFIKPSLAWPAVWALVGGAAGAQTVPQAWVEVLPLRTTATPRQPSAVAPLVAPPTPAAAFEITVEWAKPPQPTMPSAAGSADASRLISPEPVALWTLQTQDKTLYHSLSRWAQSAQWQLLWESERDFPIQAQISIEGSFSAAVQLVMNALSNTDHPLQAVMNEATRVMSIVRHQQRNEI